MDKDRRVAFACAGVGLLMGLITIAFCIAPSGWRPSALVRMDPFEPMVEIANEADPNFEFVLNGHYDGVYAYAIAIDPVATGRAHTLIDYPAYRYGRVG